MHAAKSKSPFNRWSLHWLAGSFCCIHCGGRPFSLYIGCALFALAGCVGPVSDNVGDEFRKNWLAKHTNYSTGTSPFDGLDTVAQRNQFIDEYLVIKDLQFHNYVAALRRGSSYGELTADGSRLVLDGIASVTGGASLKAGLAAASAGVTGVSGAIRKDVLFDQSLPTFIDKMEGLRANKRADIIAKKSMSIRGYPASEAYADVEDYGAQGSFDAALRAINIETARSTGQAKTALADVNGDTITAAAARGNNPVPAAIAHGRYTGAVTSRVVKVTARSTPTPTVAVNANHLRANIKLLDDSGAKAMLDTGRQYKVLRPEFDAEPQGSAPARNYLFHLIDVAANKDDGQKELAAWRSIIPARPAATPVPSPPL